MAQDTAQTSGLQQQAVIQTAESQMINQIQRQILVSPGRVICTFTEYLLRIIKVFNIIARPCM